MTVLLLWERTRELKVVHCVPQPEVVDTIAGHAECGFVPAMRSLSWLELVLLIP